MYDNIGRKIKGLAKAIFVAQGISMAIIGIVLMCMDEDLILYGVLTLILGPILAWISSWLLYGFGELIDKVSDIERNTHGETNESPSILKTKEETAATSLKETVIKKCDFCEKENIQGALCKIVDNLGTRYRYLCCDCIEKNKGNITIIK
ncbi:MAG: hypothetical protein PUC63_05445 [Clostridiales bacterium]|nr:hypothetical protein [Clostridiales bacterium]